MYANCSTEANKKSSLTRILKKRKRRINRNSTMKGNEGSKGMENYNDHFQEASCNAGISICRKVSMR